MKKLKIYTSKFMKSEAFPGEVFCLTGKQLLTCCGCYSLIFMFVKFTDKVERDDLSTGTP